jgi:AcrR family transcriptional regulator
VEVKEKIISGARQLFTKYGIRSITMDMIAEQLGVSKRTIYENFKDKDELLKYCIDEGMTEQRAKIYELIKNSENVIDATFNFIKYSINIYKTFNLLFFYDIQKYYPELCELKIKHNDKQNLDRTIELLNQGKSEYLFRNEINVEIVARLISEQFKILNNQDVFPESKFSKIEVFENIVINFIRGIATEEGFLLIEKYNR